MIAEAGEIARAEVGQFVMFPIAPYVLHRIEFRGIAWQPLDCEPPALGADEVFDQSRPMRRQPVPHHQQLAAQVAQQMAQKVHRLRYIQMFKKR